MNTSDLRRALVKRWPNAKVTTFSTEHHWAVGRFPVLPVDQSTGERSREVKVQSPLIAVAGHSLQFQLELRYEEKLRQAENESEAVCCCIGLNCSPGKEVASEVKVLFEISFAEGFANKLGPQSHTFEDRGLPYKHAITSFGVDNRNCLHQMEEQLEVFVKLNGVYIKRNAFFISQMALLESGTLSDFTVVVGDSREPIPVHRERLAACSPVFAAMFSQTDSKEAREGRVEIPDFGAEVFKDLLQFVYTGVRPRCSCLTTDLLKLADKYQVELLKQHCEQYLSTSLSVSTVVFRFQFAAMHNASALKNNCLKFMAAHYFAVTKTNAWKEFCKSGNGDLIYEATWRIAKKIQLAENAKTKNQLC